MPTKFFIPGQILFTVPADHLCCGDTTRPVLVTYLGTCPRGLVCDFQGNRLTLTADICHALESDAEAAIWNLKRLAAEEASGEFEVSVEDADFEASFNAAFPE